MTGARQRLEARRDVLVQREAAVGRHLRGEDGRHDQDFADRVSYTQMDEVLEQLDDAARAEIEAIHAALERIEHGTYGVCASCGTRIAEARLIALPHTVLCVDCA